MLSPRLRVRPVAFHGTAILIAVAALGLGAILGNWVIGPAVSDNGLVRPPLHSAKLEKAMIDAMSARPDPSPYRTPTPKFDVKDAPHYAEIARDRALAELGRRMAERRDAPEQDMREAFIDLPASAREAFGYAPDPAPQPSHRIDRHTGVVY
jgi:hypothetical protein